MFCFRPRPDVSPSEPHDSEASQSNFHNSFCSHIRQMIGLLIVFTAKMCFTKSQIFCTGYATNDKSSSTSLPPCLCVFLITQNPFINLSRTLLSPLTSAQMCLHVSSNLFCQVGRLSVGFLSLLLCPIWRLCTTECCTLVKAMVTKSLMSILRVPLFIFSIQSSHPAHSDAYLSQTHS